MNRIDFADLKRVHTIDVPEVGGEPETEASPRKERAQILIYAGSLRGIAMRWDALISAL